MGKKKVCKDLQSIILSLVNIQHHLSKGKAGNDRKAFANLGVAIRDLIKTDHHLEQREKLLIEQYRKDNNMELPHAQPQQEQQQT